MADLTAANVTVVLNKVTIQKGQKENQVTISFGDGALTYPANGVPMPGFGAFGMVRNLERLIFDGDPGLGNMYGYDVPNNKVRIWFPTQETAVNASRVGTEYVGASTVVLATTIRAIAIGW